MTSEMASTSIPWLTLSIFVPVIFGLLVLLIGRDENPGPARVLALIGSIAGFLVTLPLYTGFNPHTADMQFVENTPWIEAFNLNYHLGIDGISVWFILLTSFITVIVVLAGWEVIKSRVAQYMAAFLILSGLMIGVFCALDGMLFYVFFEATLIPMYIIIGAWGGPNRVYAALKFFLYTLLGSIYVLLTLSTFGLDPVAVAPGLRSGRNRGSEGAEPPQPAAGGCAAARHVLAGRHSAAVGLLRQAHRAAGGGERGLRAGWRSSPSCVR
ncbi:NAD(P)H-quinone oxidoreductase chain 4 [Castellaniella defragrans]